MGRVNHTVVTHFVLLGIPNTDGLQTILFVTFLAFYLCTLLGNLIIFSAILTDSRLHTPMYFFLCNLSIVDLGFSSISTPKFLANLWAQSRTISLGVCMSQVFFWHFLGCTECLLCTVMAYDRYVAICHPLRYLLIMNWRVCALLAAGTWIASSFHATILTSLTFTLPYCGSNVVEYFFCDIFPVLKLACADTYVIKMVSFTNIGMVPTACFLLILASYIRIVYSVLKINSAEGRRKAVSACASHLAVVTLFFGPCALVYTQPQLSKVLVTPVQLFSNVVTPVAGSKSPRRTIYLLTLLGNLVILLTISLSLQCHSPVYYFLSELSLLDICHSSVMLPRMLADFLVGSRSIFLGCCVAQLYSFHFFGDTECFLLMVLTYDQYVATCDPLHYARTMNQRAQSAGPLLLRRAASAEAGLCRHLIK
ncbi:putative olfactory receptor 10D4 [Mauremys reevesii]|uniref:putative olfactory receptor 10D4 n=1 Tax=Mauremys reevesii TaxID=260615 RepID=UPI00193F527F|nr:putative olfactory receptor 10D4 [Mauremys reevesii]